VRGLEVFGEMARSLADPNRLSEVGGISEDGGAYYGGVRLAALALPLGTLSGEVVGRYKEDDFEPFSRIRPVEFNRRWNVARSGAGFAGIDTLAEATAEGFLRWAYSERSHLQIEGGRIELGDRFDGQRGAIDLAFREGRWPGLSYRLDLVDAENGLAGEEGRWLRQRGRLDYPVPNTGLVPFVEVEQERRDQAVLGTDSLVVDAIDFVEVRPGVQWTGPRLTAGAQVELRDERLPLGGAFADAATARTVRADARFRPSSAYTTEAQLAYRTRRFTEPFAEAGALDNESVVVRWTNRWTPWQRAIELSTVYEAQTERSPVLQEVYIRVGQELGEYVWEDLNGDGVQQLDEFREEVTPLEGEYLRTFIPGDELIPTIGVQGRLRLRLDPARLLGDAPAGWRAALAQVASLTTLDVQETSEEPDLARVYLLDPGALQDPATTLNGRFRIGQELTFFRDRTRYGGRLYGQHLRSTNRLATGLERRRVQQLDAEAQAQALDPLSLRLRASWERTSSESAFASRRFDIESVEAEPEATWRFSPAFTLTGGLRLARNRDTAGEPREARILIVPLRLRIAAANRLQLLLSAERADVRVDGPLAVGQAGFELTERRGEGVSYLWSAGGQYALNQFLRATLNYEGRAPAATPTIHNVRVQLSAVF
jgi:hypothetical protein